MQTSNEFFVLTGVAISIAFMHTVTGPDHYIPFIGMARAGRWSRRRTLWITALCGIGHVAGSAALAVLGTAAFLGVERALALESFRSEIAAWGLIAFGLVYGAWGLRRAVRSRSHDHPHVHADGSTHRHPHDHHGEHVHAHASAGSSYTPWVLFAIFVFGPCEPMIPLLMYPAVKSSLVAAVWVTLVFTLVTILTMVGIVAAALEGLELRPMKLLDRYAHALAGGAVFACGLAIRFLGL